MGWLNKLPPELFGDEVDVGYQAYSLLKTGQDLYGQTLPSYIRSLAESRAPLLIYATVPTIAIFGNNEWGVRLPEAIFGSLAPLILFLLVYKLSRSPALSLSSSLALAIMPWHIYYSRSAFEVVIMLDLIMLGSLLFLKRRFEFSALSFALAMYTYSTAVLFVPIWTVCLVLIHRQRINLKFIITGLIVALPLLYQIVLGSASQRFSVLNVANNGDFIKRLTELRNNSGPIIGHLIYNKPETFINAVFANYLRSFSSDFLFVKGDPTYRHSIQIIGQLFPFTAPFVLLGVYYLISRKKFFWLAWLILAPLPSSLTADGGYHATRLFLMIPPLAVSMGAGAYLVYCWVPLRWRRLVFSGVVVILSWQMFSSGYYYIVHYRLESWRWWHVGFKDAMTQVGRLAPNYSQVFINNTYEPSLERFLFWTSYPPQEFHRQFTVDQAIANVTPNYNGFFLGPKYYFGQFSDNAKSKGVANSLLPNSLYVISQRDDVAGDWDWRFSPPIGVKVLFTSVNLYNQPILYLITKE